MPQTRRTKKLIKPGLQLRLCILYLAAAGIAVMGHAILLNHGMAELGSRLPNDEAVLLSEWPVVFKGTLILTFALLVPLIFVVGVLATFRLTGPIHRFETFLTNVMKGVESEPCTLRDEDDLGELCKLLNEVTEELRADARRRPRSVPEETRRAG